MREWELVWLFGAIGGIVASLVEVHGTLRAFFRGSERANQRRISGWCLTTAITAVIAGAGACVVWALYTTTTNFDVLGIDPQLAAESFIVGLGGVGAVRKYMSESERGELAERNAADTADTVGELARLLRENLDKPVPLGQDGEGGHDP